MGMSNILFLDFRYHYLLLSNLTNKRGDLTIMRLNRGRYIFRLSVIINDLMILVTENV